MFAISQLVELTVRPAGPGWPHTSRASARMSGTAGPLLLHGLFLFFSPQALSFSDRLACACFKV